ncbi:MAG TPA: hypothetical protein PK498_04225 [Candidatus Kapabacteria bacterium]|nr:hypothetical protein [Candidatus Kapabacteria bacterium]
MPCPYNSKILYLGFTTRVVGAYRHTPLHKKIPFSCHQNAQTRMSMLPIIGKPSEGYKQWRAPTINLHPIIK